MSLAIIPGSYDPPTLGHVELIRRAARLFDRVIALVMVNDQKQALFSLEERFSLVKESVAGIPGAEADFFGGMTLSLIHISIVCCPGWLCGAALWCVPGPFWRPPGFYGWWM